MSNNLTAREHVIKMIKELGQQTSNRQRSAVFVSGNSLEGPPSAGRRVTGASSSWLVLPGAVVSVVDQSTSVFYKRFSPKQIKAYREFPRKKSEIKQLDIRQSGEFQFDLSWVRNSPF